MPQRCRCRPQALGDRVYIFVLRWIRNLMLWRTPVCLLGRMLSRSGSSRIPMCEVCTADQGLCSPRLPVHLRCSIRTEQSPCLNVYIFAISSFCTVPPTRQRIRQSHRVDGPRVLRSDSCLYLCWLVYFFHKYLNSATMRQTLFWALYRHQLFWSLFNPVKLLRSSFQVYKGRSWGTPGIV